MAKTDFKTVDDYLATMPEATRKVLDEVRAIIRDTLPGADEVISYQIPAYKQDGVAVIYFAGWKEHYSLYPIGDGFAEAFPEEAAKYPISKGTIRFALNETVPKTLIRKIVSYRAGATSKDAAAKSVKKRKS